MAKLTLPPQISVHKEPEQRGMVFPSDIIGNLRLEDPLIAMTSLKERIINGTRRWARALNVEFREYIHEKIFRDRNGVVDAECGDDYISVSKPLLFCQHLGVLELLGMKISREDTSLHPYAGTYTEGVFLLPPRKEYSWTAARVLLGTRSPLYIDVEKIRVVLPSSSERMKHSESVEGRVSVLTKTIGQSGLKGLTGTYSLAILCQMGAMGWNYSRPYCLPKVLGGLGGRIPFACPTNIDRYFRAYKHGRYRSVLYAIAEKVREFISSVRKGQKPARSPTLSRISSAFRFADDHIKKDMDFRVRRFEDDIPQEFQKRLVAESLDGMPFGKYQSAVRLLAIREFVTETSLSHWLRHRHFIALMYGDIPFPKCLEQLEAHRTKGPGNSNWMEEVLSESVILNLNIGKIISDSDLNDLQILCESHTLSRFLKRSFIRNERIYDWRAKDEAFQKGGLCVPIEFGELGFADDRQVTTADLDWENMVNPELDPVRKELRAYFESKDPIYVQGKFLTVDSALNEETKRWLGQYAPPFLTKGFLAFSDDERIIQEIKYIDQFFDEPVYTVIIVTDDKRLMLAAMSVRPFGTYLRYPVERHHAARVFPNVSSARELQATRMGYKSPVYALYDTGSIISGEEKYVDRVNRKLYLKRKVAKIDINSTVPEIPAPKVEYCSQYVKKWPQWHHIYRPDKNRTALYAQLAYNELVLERKELNSLVFGHVHGVKDIQQRAEGLYEPVYQKGVDFSWDSEEALRAPRQQLA